MQKKKDGEIRRGWEIVAGRQSETERQHIIWNSQPMCWDPSEPILCPILLWILKHLCAPPASLLFFLLYLFFFWVNMMVSFPSLSPLCLFITVRMGFMSYHEAVKTQAFPRGLSCHRTNNIQTGTLFVVPHWIFHLNLWNIHRRGQGHGPPL